MRVKLTIKNYRCFVRPTTVEIKKGFTAFVGVNNAGKSTLMRFLLEFRPLFQRIMRGNGDFSSSFHEGKNHPAVNLLHVLDKDEVFSNLNQDGLEFRFDFLYDENEQRGSLPKSVTFKVRRNFQWSTEAVTRDGNSTASSYGVDFLKGDELSVRVRSPIDKVTFLMAPLYQVAETLGTSLYVGPFRNIINIGTKADYLDIQIGESFIQGFRTFKTGPVKVHNLAMNRLTDDIRRIFEFQSFNIEASNDAQSLHITINGKPYKQHELGSGLMQFILVLANAAIKNPSFVLIDEPELNLHPRLQLDFMTTLGSYCKDGVWFSSHSLGLARSTAESIYSVQRMGDGDSIVRQLAEVPRLSEFLGEMSFSAHKELGFEKILLVEGPTEVKTIQQILRKMKKDHKFVLLSLHGRITGDMSEEIEEVQRITPHIAALIDSEKTSANAPLGRTREQFVELCKLRNIPCHVVTYRATENYFSDRAVKEVLGSNYRALGPYEKLDAMSPNWQKAQNWQLANAMTLEEFLQKDFGQFLQGL